MRSSSNYNKEAKSIQNGILFSAWLCEFHRKRWHCRPLHGILRIQVGRRHVRHEYIGVALDRQQEGLVYFAPDAACGRQFSF